tara:strand:+ start:229 stop:537 length:309 start_codon:yes stop_codon:yes gene_type:complete
VLINLCKLSLGNLNGGGLLNVDGKKRLLVLFEYLVLFLPQKLVLVVGGGGGGTMFGGILGIRNVLLLFEISKIFLVMLLELGSLKMVLLFEFLVVSFVVVWA